MTMYLSNITTMMIKMISNNNNTKGYQDHHKKILFPLEVNL